MPMPPPPPALALPPAEQLVLPLGPPPVSAPRPTTALVLAPAQLWPSLPAVLRAQLRRALIQLLQEVAPDADC